MIKLSICIPTYNRAHDLRKTLGFILPQVTGKPVEIVISDNASTDATYKVVQEFQGANPCIRYGKNSSNIGLDRNTIECVRLASGEYCWLCSDDDIPLPGSLDAVLAALEQFAPRFMYLGFAGYLENEDYTAALKRYVNKEATIFDDAEKMMRKLLLNHFSATITKKELFLKYSSLLDRYEKLGFERGYVLTINHYIVLMENAGPLVHIDKLCLAVKARHDSSYNPLTTLTDTACHYQLLVKEGLISEYSERYVLDWFLRGFYKLLLPMRLYGHPAYTVEFRDRLVQLCGKYRNFRVFLYPYMVLPKWMLYIPYVIVRKLKAFARMIFELSPF